MSDTPCAVTIGRLSSGLTAVTLDAAIDVSRLRVLCYSAGVDNLLPALTRMAVGVDTLAVEQDYDLVGVSRMDDAACLRIVHLRWSPWIHSWRQTLDLSRFRNLLSFESTNNMSVSFHGPPCRRLERLAFYSEGLIDEHSSQGLVFDDTTVYELADAIEDEDQWPGLAVVTITTPRPPRDHERDRRWMSAVGDAVETVRSACEARGVKFALV